MPRYTVFMNVTMSPKRVTWLVDASNPNEACEAAEREYRAYLPPGEADQIDEMYTVDWIIVPPNEAQQ